MFCLWEFSRSQVVEGGLICCVSGIKQHMRVKTVFSGMVERTPPDVLQIVF